jgi:biotin transport system substrate-specific component
MEQKELQQWVLCALFTAFMIVGAQTTIPLPLVPFVLTDFFIILAGLVLGSRWGAMSVVLYLLLGAIGLPVFAGFSGGYHHFFGPTGGYLVGFVVAAMVAGALAAHNKPAIWRDALAAILGQKSLYILGVSWLVVGQGMTWNAAIAAGVLPFLAGAAIKLSVAVLIAPILRRQIARYNDILS